MMVHKVFDKIEGKAEKAPETPQEGQTSKKGRKAPSKGGSEPQEPESAPKHPLEDEVGQVIPADIADRYLARSIIGKHIKALDEMRNVVDNCDEMTYQLLNHKNFFAIVTKLKSILKNGQPHAICPYCHGKCCRACHQFGFVNRPTWKAAPKGD